MSSQALKVSKVAFQVPAQIESVQVGVHLEVQSRQSMLEGADESASVVGWVQRHQEPESKECARVHVHKEMCKERSWLQNWG